MPIVSFYRHNLMEIKKIMSINRLNQNSSLNFNELKELGKEVLKESQEAKTLSISTQIHKNIADLGKTIKAHLNVPTRFCAEGVVTQYVSNVQASNGKALLKILDVPIAIASANNHRRTVVAEKKAAVIKQLVEDNINLISSNLNTGLINKDQAETLKTQLTNGLKDNFSFKLAKTDEKFARWADSFWDAGKFHPFSRTPYDPNVQTLELENISDKINNEFVKRNNFYRN